MGDVEEGGAEVVAPLRDAVRLVHGQQAHGPAGFEQRLEAGIRQAFGRGEHDARAAVGHGRLGRARFLGVQRAVQLHGRYAALAQRIALVAHERDQRRHHHRAAREQQRGQLVAQRLAGTRGHDGQRVLAAQHAVDHIALARTQGAQAEGLLQGRLDAGLAGRPLGAAWAVEEGMAAIRSLQGRAPDATMACRHVHLCSGPGPLRRVGRRLPTVSSGSVRCQNRACRPTATVRPLPGVTHSRLTDVA